MRLKCLTDRCVSVAPTGIHPAADPVAVDFETYYDKNLDIKTLGMYSYVTHPKCHAYLVAIYADDGDMQYAGPVETAPWAAINGRPWWSHNAAFDAHVFEEARKRGAIPADVEPCTWDCTADMSVYFKAPRALSGAARELLGAILEKETRDLMKGKTYEDAKTEGMIERLHKYALEGDAKHCYLLAKKHGAEWPEHEYLISRLNRKAGSRGLWVNVPLAQSYVKSLQYVLWACAHDIPWEWEEGKTPLSLPMAREQCRIDGIPAPTSFAEDSEAFDTWAGKHAKDHKWIYALGHWRKANMMLKKISTVLSRVREDGSFPYLTKYFGAHTGRFSGSDRFNVQNMPKAPMDLTDLMKEADERFPRQIDLRSVFIPPPGKKMAIVDLSQIEARVILYLAGDTKQLELVRGGMDVYEAHARATMGYDLSISLKDAAKEDPKYSDMRQYAKARVLGAGFGAGGPKFREVAKIMAGLELTAEESAKTIAAYREANQPVVALWGRLHHLLKMSAVRNEPLQLTLPTGRRLSYFEPHFEMGDIKARVERGGTFYKFYGGKLAENCTQALARDAFISGLLEAEKAGYDLMLHVHDEGAWSVDEGTAEQDFPNLRKLMETPQPWAPDFPIGSDGSIETEYCK